MSKEEILKNAYPVLIECFAGWHGEIFREYWEDPLSWEPDGSVMKRESTAYKSIEECYKDLREEIYPDKFDKDRDIDENDTVSDREIWEEIDNEVGDDPYEKCRRILLYNESHGEVWGGVTCRLYYSNNKECWKLLADLLVSLDSDRGGEIGWDN
jgi:hypothetical protein